MKVRYLLSLMILPTVIAAGFYAQPVSAQGFVAGRIIDDSKFTAKSSMSVSQIQTFLNNKVPTCDTNGQQLSEFGGPDINGDGKVQRWEWGKSRYNQTKFICLKNYSEGGKNASQIIYDAAQEFSISPKVLLVLLQKEQALVTDSWPLNIQYRSATGYGCPDTAACDAEYYGFTNQVRWAGRMFRAILNDSPTWYTPYNLGNNYIRYNPDASCGGSTVLIQNRSTQALYNYTPYQPNAAALAAGWGTATCGAYGNRNFFLYYTHWFGSPISNTPYAATEPVLRLYSDSARTQQISSTGTASVKAGSTVYASLSYKNSGDSPWYNSFVKVATLDPRNHRNNPFYSDAWYSQNRPARLSESLVYVGDRGTFNFTLKAPDTLTTITRYFGLVADGQDSGWMDNNSVKVSLTTTPAKSYSAKIISKQAFYDEELKRPVGINKIALRADQKIYIRITIKNNGSETLDQSFTRATTADPNGHNGSVFVADTWLSTNRLTALDQPQIATGETGSFTFALKAPSDTGRYTESFAMVADGMDGGWMDDELATISIGVIDYPSVLNTSEGLSAGMCLYSNNAQYKACYQPDGNFVLYSPRKPLWATGTDRTTPRVLAVQKDGNLVLYAKRKPVWASNTDRLDDSKLVLQDDGNLVLYRKSTGKPTWASHTYNKY